jgi:hypothetical protein
MRTVNVPRSIMAAAVVALACGAFAIWAQTPLHSQTPASMFRVHLKNPSGGVLVREGTNEPVTENVKAFWCSPDGKSCVVVVQ